MMTPWRDVPPGTSKQSVFANAAWRINPNQGPEADLEASLIGTVTGTVLYSSDETGLFSTAAFHCDVAPTSHITSPVFL
jgi:hypothetical protein